MSKHAWRIIIGGFIFFAPFVTYRLIRLIITYGDGIWSEIFWGRFWLKDVPGVGLVLLLFMFYCVGWLKETRVGTWLYEKILERIPFIGKIFISPKKKSQQLLNKINGFVFGPIWSGYRPARITSVFPIRGGGLWVVLSFLMFPAPAVQSYPDSTVIHAIKRRTAGVEHYDPIPEALGESLENGYTVFSTEIGLRIEFTGGTTVDENVFLDLCPVTLKEFLESQRFNA